MGNQLARRIVVRWPSLEMILRPRPWLPDCWTNSGSIRWRRDHLRKDGASSATPQATVRVALQRSCVKTSPPPSGTRTNSVLEFEQDLSNNLYRLWNRIHSGH